MSTSSSPPLEVPSPAQTNNHSSSTTTVASSTTMPVTITTSTTAAQSIGSNSTSSNSVSSSILNSKNKTNLLANHLSGNSNLTNNLNATIIEQTNGNGTQNFCLKWNLHTSNLIRNLTEMVASQQIVDVTLACDGSSIKAHKIILSACSNYFKELFLANPCKHPIVILKDVRINEMRAIIDFMYKGEVNVAQSQLASLLKTAEILRVKGLTEVTTADGVDIEAILIADEKDERQTPVNHHGGLMNKLSGLDSAVAAVAASLNGKILSNGLSSNYDGLHTSNDLNNSNDQLYNNNLLNLASLSSLRMNNNLNNLNNLNSLNNSTNTLLNLRESAQTELLKRRKKRKKGGYYYSNKSLNHSSQDGDQAISLVTNNKEGSENNENSSNSCNSSNNSTDNSTINNSLRNLCYIKKEAQLADHGGQSDCDNYSGDESNDTLKRTKDLLNVIAAAGAFQGSSVANFYRSSTPESSNQSLLAIRRKLMQQQLNTLSPKGGQDLPDDSDGSNWLQSKRMVEASMIESYEDNEEEMIDVRPIVSLDEGSSSVPTNFNSDQMVVMNSLDINSMTSNSPGLQSGKICVCNLCHITFTAHSSLRRHMQRHDVDRERYECDICQRSYSRKDYLKEHKKLKHSGKTQVPNIAAN